MTAARAPRSRGERALLVLLPLVAVASVTLALVAGHERPVAAACVWGVPAEGARTMALRIQSTARKQGAPWSAAFGGRIGIEARAGGAPLPVQLRWPTRDIVEATVESDEPLRGALDLRITQGPTVLAEGSVPLRVMDPPKSDHRMIEGDTSGEIQLRVESVYGPPTSTYTSLRIVAIRPEGVAPEGVEITATTQGTTFSYNMETDADGTVEWRFQPAAERVALELVARPKTERQRATGATGQWKGTLAVRRDALVIDADDLRVTGELRIWAPSYETAAYVSVLSAEGREHGAVVSVDSVARKLYRGSFTVPEALRRRAVAVTVARDPGESGADAMLWPIPPEEGDISAPRIERLLDGTGAAEARERRRSIAVCAAGLVAALLAIALEGWLLRRRRSALRVPVHEGADRIEIPAASRP